MRICLLLAAAATLHAAVIRGSVVENLTGRAVQRASVLLEPVPGSPGTRAVTRTDRFGFFEFSGEPAGIYLLQVSRPPYLTVLYGQKRWNSAGHPLTVSENEATFLSIHMLRFGSISGAVLDVNSVGIPDFPVAVYRNSRPIELAGNATADERGMFRIPGLLPGQYLVRSLGKEIEEVGFKPTYSPETEAPETARVVDVEIEQDSRDVNINPLPGQLFRLDVLAEPTDPPDEPVTMTFVSETGRQVVQGAAHTFSGLPRGEYEIFAEAPTDSPGLKQSNYTRVNLVKDTSVRLTLRHLDPSTFLFDGAPLGQVSSGGMHVLARRKDLAGWHGLEEFHLGSRINLTVGPWEFALDPSDGYYVAGFSGPGPYHPNQPPAGWNEANITFPATLRFKVASNPGSLSGMVLDAGNPAVGAPVYLEPIDIEPARRLTKLFTAITGTDGRYRFPSLAPGHYRVLSSFEYQSPDSQTMIDAGAREVVIGARGDVAQDLDLYVIP